MRYIVLVIACVTPYVTLLAGHKGSVDDNQEPGSRVTETRTGNFDQKIVIDHHKYDGLGTQTERSDDDLSFVYPDDVQLVPNVPISPESPKYALVPIKRLKSESTRTDESTSNYDIGFTPTIPSDFQQEIASIRIPHTGLPAFITDPPPPKDEEEEEEEEGEDEEKDEDTDEEEPNNDHFFTDEFLEPPEFKDVPTTSKPTPLFSPEFRSRRVRPTKPTSQLKPTVVTKASSFFKIKSGDDFDVIPTKGREKIRKVKTIVKHGYLPALCSSLPMTPSCNRNTHVPQYFPSQPMARMRAIHAYPVYWGPPKMVRGQAARVYVRYPRNHRPYYQPPGPPAYGRVRVMTQNFVQHPRNRYHHRNPVMMPSVEFRTKKPPSGKKKKKKKSKGGCKPKRIIQEIHYHHYDPQLSAQLAPLEGINFKEGDEYENQVKIITKETEVEDDVKKGHEDYEQHNSNLEKEMKKHKAETEQRLAHPEYHSDDYSPHYSDNSGSTEYIDYNIQTDSSSEIRDPHPAHEYPEDRAFRTPSYNNTHPFTPVTPLQGGRYVKHKVIKYYYHSPDNVKR